MTHQIHLTNGRADGFQTALAHPHLMETFQVYPEVHTVQRTGGLSDGGDVLFPTNTVTHLPQPTSMGPSLAHRSFAR